MQRALLCLFLFFYALPSFSQGMYGFEAGVGKTTSYKSYLTPELEAYLLTNVNRSLDLGGSVSYQRYSFRYASNISPAAVNYGDVINVRLKSSFIFFCPRADIGIGYHKYLHLILSLGGGIHAGGSEWTNRYEQIFTLPAATTFRSDTAGFNTSYNSPTFAFRYAAGLSERLPARGNWNIVLSQEFGYLPGSLDRKLPNLTTNYVSFTVGIMHKNGPVEVEY
jgi:hypothetical protein